MIKKLNFIISLVFLFVLTIFFGHSSNNKALAASPNPQYTSSTTSFTIRGGNNNDTYDANGKAILKPHQQQGYNVITLDASLNGGTAELPVGTFIFLHFPKGSSTVSANPSKGIIEYPGGKYHLPNGDIGIYKVVGQGTATITVAERLPLLDFTTNNAASTSGNWAGYWHVGIGRYTEVSSHWTVPTASGCNGTFTNTSDWVGIDGYQDNNSNLIQTGTESTCPSGSSTPTYDAWWEILPASETVVCAVNAGDSMYAEVKYVSGNTWKFTIKDLTTGTDCSPANQSYSGSGTSIEWIAEDPSYTSGGLEPLTNYGTVTLTNDTQNGANPLFNYSTASENMVQGGIVVSATSNPNSLKDAFTVAYGSTQPSAPAAWSNNSPSGSTNDSIYSISAGNNTGIWASGYEQPSSGYGVPVTYFNNGSGWTKYLPPDQGGAQNLEGIAQSRSGDAWTVGHNAITHMVTLAYHWNSSTNSWTYVTSDQPTNFPADLTGVGIDDLGNVFAVGNYSDGSNQQPLLEKWNGTNFAQQTLSLPSGAIAGVLNGVAFNSSTKGWAVGYVATSNPGGGYTYPYVIYQYNGSSWTPSSGIPSGATAATLVSVTTISASSAWAVGSKIVNGASVPLIMHYTSTNGWQEDTSFSNSFPPSTTLYSVAGDSSRDVWIVGNTGSGPYSMHYNGSSWKKVTTPSISGASILRGVTVANDQAWTGGQNIPSGQSRTNPLTFKSL